MTRKIGKYVKISAVILMLITALISVPSRHYHAAETVEVYTAENFIAAASNPAVDTVILKTSVTLSDVATINHNMHITGGDSISLTIEAGAQIKTAANTSVTFSNVRLEGIEGYAVSAYGNIVIGDNVSLSGDYGILLNKGTELTTENRTLSVQGDMHSAIGIYPEGGQVVLNNVSVSLPSGSSTAVILHNSDGTLLLNNSISISAAGNAFACQGSSNTSPSVSIADNSTVSIYAPNTTALYTMRDFIAGDGSSIDITGGKGGISAQNITVGNNAKLNISCMNSASKGYALTASGAFSLKNNVTLNINASEPTGYGGIYSKDDLTTGIGCQILIRCIGTAVYCPEPIYFNDDTTLNIREAANGIDCTHGIITGSRCSFDFSALSGYGIRSTGTLIADKLEFGENNTINISTDFCSIYTKEAFQIAKGGRVQLTAGTKAPALWIDADSSAPGYVTIVGSSVTVASSANSTAARNAGVYVVGAITAEQNSVFFVESSGDFAITSVNGDINVSSGASLYARSGCGLYLLNGDLRLSSGGSLFTHGMMDSAVRIEEGVINVGDSAVIDAQGARFGAEILGNGGLWISGAASFDIRSTTERAVYIENGSLSIENVERVSVWHRAEDGNNPALWWTGADLSAASWELTDDDSELAQIYADYTRLSPSGSQTFRNGEPIDTSSLNWSNAPWETYKYSRIGMYKSRPTARSNTFNIPAGKSFSWWLYGESYDGEPARFRLETSSGDGEFNLSENGKFTYTAPAHTRGTQSFSFTVINQEDVSSEPAEIKILVTASKPPISYSSTFFTPADTPLLDQINVQDFDGAISNTTITRQPSNGTLTLSSDGKFLYTPNANFVGIDDFEFYSVDDFGDNSNTGYVSVIVGANAGIFSYNDTYTTDSGTAVNARLVVAEIFTPEPASPSDVVVPEANQITEGLRYHITQNPKYGTFSVSADGLVSYTPYEDFAGTDIFKFYAEDEEGNRSNEAYVTISIIPSQRPTVTEGYFTCAKNYYCDGHVSADDIDGTIINYELVTEPESGSLTFDSETGKFSYKPERDFIGTVHFTFRALDNDGLLSNETVVYIDVMSLIDNLKATDRLIPCILAASGILISIIVIAVLVISAAIKRHKREQLEVDEYYREMGIYNPKK